MRAEATDLAPAAVIRSLAALAHETRLALFRELVRKGGTGESAGELARRLAIPPQTLSFHLKEMTNAGLLGARREGRYIYYVVDFDHARRLVGYLVDSCCADEPTTSTDRKAGIMDQNDVRQLVKEHYGSEARRVRSGAAGCAAGSCDPVSSDLYGQADQEAVPAEALQASLGCGNPAALAQLQPGEVVLDLGSGGGIDVLLSARRVGPAGKAYGLDMTDEMLALAEENKKRSGLQNAEFFKGEIEDVPLPDGSVDVIISNCVINLSADKNRVLREAFRVLRPGGRFAVSDIVIRGQLPAELRQHAGLWAGCFAGALEESDYRSRLEAAGFAGIEIQPTRILTRDEARDLLGSEGLDADRLAPQVAGKVISAFVRAVKP